MRRLTVTDNVGLVFAGIAHAARPTVSAVTPGIVCPFVGRRQPRCNIYLSFGVDKQEWERREGHRRHQEGPPELQELRRSPHEASSAAADDALAALCKMKDERLRSILATTTRKRPTQVSDLI